MASNEQPSPLTPPPLRGAGAGGWGQTLTPRIERQARGDWLRPAYDGQSLVNVVASVLDLFGLPAPHPPLPEPMVEAVRGCQHVILLLLDGFGLNLWQRAALRLEPYHRLTEQGYVAPITSVFPSTTAAGLTAVASGLTPQEHGLPEWLVYFREIDRILETLPFQTIVAEGQAAGEALAPNPRLLCSGETIYQRLAAADIPSYYCLPRAYQDGVFTRASSRGSTILPYDNLEGLTTALARTLATAAEPSYLYAYWPTVDSAVHQYGPAAEQVWKAVIRLGRHLQQGLAARIDPALAQQTALLITADHGHLAIDPTETVYLNQWPTLVEHLRRGARGQRIGATGGPRDAFLSLVPGSQDQVEAFLREEHADQLRVLATDEALAQGLYGAGPVHPEFRSRAGDLLLLPHGNLTLYYQHNPARRFTMLGHHGGLDPDEMLIPLVAAPLSALE